MTDQLKHVADEHLDGRVDVVEASLSGDRNDLTKMNAHHVTRANMAQSMRRTLVVIASHVDIPQKPDVVCALIADTSGSHSGLSSRIAVTV